MPMLLAQLGLAGAAGAGFRERDALLERGDAIRDRDVARHLGEQLGRFVDFAGRERRFCRSQRFLAGRGQELPENSRTCASGIAPMNCATARPSLNAMTFGIERMLNACESSGFSSELIFTSLTRPPNACATLSRVGPERAARAAPRRPEIDDDGNCFRGFDDLALESGCADVHVRHCTARARAGRGRGDEVLASYAHDSPDRPNESRARLLALGALGVAVLGGVAVVRLGARRPVGDSEPSRAGPVDRLRADRAGDGLDAALRDRVPDDPVHDGQARGSRRRVDRPNRARRDGARATDGERGYLESLLAALEIDPSSQTLVYSQTSLQSELIGPKTPRAIYFNDDVYVGYVQRAPIEIASLDPESRAPCSICSSRTPPAPKFSAELGRCLSCHDSYSLTGGGVPRFIVGSGYTGTTGMLVSHEGWILISDRTPLKSRWGGWYVTGQHGSQVHLGNMVIKSLYDFDRLEELRVGNVDTLDALVDVKPYLTNTSDIVALLVLQHQADVQNLITRLHL